MPLPSLAAVDPPPPVSPLIHIPKTTATSAAVKSCQVFQERRSLILSSPGLGSTSGGAASLLVSVAVTAPSSSTSCGTPCRLPLDTSLVTCVMVRS